jgi:hypothetical protein
VRDRDLRRIQHLRLLELAPCPLCRSFVCTGQMGVRIRTPLTLRHLMEIDAGEVYNTEAAGSMGR